MASKDSQFDVAIVGAGLAGLTLALQINQAKSNLSIVVLERNKLPPPVAAHKVGEATVEIGAHYLSHTLGLEPLLERTQLHKFGLRLFFGSGQHDDLSKADELGSSKFLPAISYQLDRGLLEADLAKLLDERGVTITANCLAKHIDVGTQGKSHRLQIVRHGQTETVQCRWLIDASARSGVLKRELGLAKPSEHRMCAAWFRLDSVIDVDEWSDSPDWKDRCHGLPRRLSTNHFMGSGYWAWIIPLAGNKTSVGLVTDPAIHPLSSFNNFGRLQDWLASFEPQLAEQVADSKRTLMDFMLLKDLSQDSRKVWSSDRWGLSGESGLFADPFYSPGTDFIGISNTFICDLITRDRSQLELGVHAGVYEKMYKSFYESTMSLYKHQYAGFGDTRLMVVKTTWDYAYYWSILSWLFFREVLTDIVFIRTIQPQLAKIRALNEDMQAEFRKRADEKRVSPGKGRFFDQSAIPVLADLNAALLKSPDHLQLEFTENCERLEGLAPLLLSMLANDQSRATSADSLLGDLNHRLG